MTSIQQKNQHLLWRAGFGLVTDDIITLSNKTPTQVYASLVMASAKQPQHLDVAKDLSEMLGISEGQKDMAQMRQRMMEPKKRREFLKLSREVLRNLNLTWMDHMVTTQAQLREKMSLFWHSHFACRDLNGIYQQLLLNDIRANALGSFKDLLFTVSKSASMLSFLNNLQNRKQHPNENFAREVMELFTLGRGNYTENDVKEAARAFTGWSFQPTGEFAFRTQQHDTGLKTILGKTGNFDGDSVLNILLEQKQTAKHITTKIYKYFVNEKVDENKVNWLADRFYQSKYNIQSLMDDIFTSNWFYSESNIGNHIKSPVELLVGIRRTIPMKMENQEVLLLMQRALGQVLFYPPNVAGWPGGKTWIDSSSLMFRLRIPKLIKDNEIVNINAKTDDDVSMGMSERVTSAANATNQRRDYNINANVDWETYIKQFDKVPREKLFDALRKVLHQTSAYRTDQSTIEKTADKSSRENYIKSVTVALMSTPEYQVC